MAQTKQKPKLSYVELLAKKNTPHAKVTVATKKALDRLVKSITSILTMRVVELDAQSQALSKASFVTVTDVLVSDEAFMRYVMEFPNPKSLIHEDIIVKASRAVTNRPLDPSAIAFLQALSEALVVDLLAKANDLSTTELNVIHLDDVLDAIQMHPRFDFISNMLLPNTSIPSQIRMVQHGGKVVHDCGGCLPVPKLKQTLKRWTKGDIEDDGVHQFKVELIDIVFNIVRNSERMATLDKVKTITFAHVMDAIAVTQGLVNVSETTLLAMCKSAKVRLAQKKAVQTHFDAAVVEHLVTKAKTKKTFTMSADAHLVLRMYLELYTVALLERATMIRRISTRNAITAFDLEMVRRIRTS